MTEFDDEICGECGETYMKYDERGYCECEVCHDCDELHEDCVCEEY